MKGRACQKVFLGGGFPRFKRIMKPLDVVKTGGLGQFYAGHGLHQSNSPVQRYHLGDQKVITNALMPLPYCSGPGMFSGKRPLTRARHSGQSLISASTFTSTTVNLISRRTRCSRADGSMSERSVPQLSQTSIVEISSTVVVSKFSPSSSSLPRSYHGSFWGLLGLILSDLRWRDAGIRAGLFGANCIKVPNR